MEGLFSLDVFFNLKLHQLFPRLLLELILFSFLKMDLKVCILLMLSSKGTSLINCGYFFCSKRGRSQLFLVHRFEWYFESSSQTQLGICFRELAIAPPMLGTSQLLLNNNHSKVYFEGMPRKQGTSVFLRRHGDEMERLPGGYYRALGRSDDTMNLGGIKVKIMLNLYTVSHAMLGAKSSLQVLI